MFWNSLPQLIVDIEMWLIWWLIYHSSVFLCHKACFALKEYVSFIDRRKSNEYHSFKFFNQPTQSCHFIDLSCAQAPEQSFRGRLAPVPSKRVQGNDWMLRVSDYCYSIKKQKQKQKTATKKKHEIWRRRLQDIQKKKIIIERIVLSYLQPSPQAFLVDGRSPSLPRGRYFGSSRNLF